MDRTMNALEKKLLDGYQRGFPLTARPYEHIANELGVGEDDVLAALANLKEAGVLSRVGAVFKPNGVGHSTLAALAVPPERLEEIAALVNGYEAVNHNYERENKYNLWFVIAAADEAGVNGVLSDIEEKTGLKALNLPMLNDYHLDLGFALRWN